MPQDAVLYLFKSQPLSLSRHRSVPRASARTWDSTSHKRTLRMADCVAPLYSLGMRQPQNPNGLL